MNMAFHLCESSHKPSNILSHQSSVDKICMNMFFHLCESSHEPLLPWCSKLLVTKFKRIWLLQRKKHFHELLIFLIYWNTFHKFWMNMVFILLSWTFNLPDSINVLVQVLHEKVLSPVWILGWQLNLNFPDSMKCLNPEWILSWTFNLYDSINVLLQILH